MVAIEKGSFVSPSTTVANFFYFNHFSLIFYRSVWLGFELFGLRVQMCSQLVQFTLVRKGYDNHHCHNKPQTGNEAVVWMTSCPEEKGREFGRFCKRVSWVPTMNRTQKLYRLSPWSGWTGFLPSKYSINNIAVNVVHWRRYFRIWLREGSQVLPGKTPCLPQIFHRRIDNATRGRRLPELTPPGFSPVPL